MRRSRIVVIGAGFGGMQAAQSLANSDTNADILLIDRHNYNTFIPLLYQVTTAQLDPEHIALPIRTLLRRFSSRRRRASAIQFLMAEVTYIDLANQCVETPKSRLPYDYLVIATGSQTQYLGVPGAEHYAWPMQTLNEAIALRNQILSCLEQAATEPDPMRQQHLLTFAIVGGGPTGVEMVGALVEWLRGPIRRDYPHLDLRQARILLLQSGTQLLPGLPRSLGDYTYRRLQKLGVQVHLQARVSHIQPEALHLQDGRTFACHTVIWAAGVQAETPDLSDGVPTLNKGKLVVKPTLQLLEHPQIYAIGDAAYATQAGKALSGVAPEALQAGVAVARNIKRQLRGQDPTAFRYFNKGRLAIIGCGSGVGQIGPLAITGFVAWFMWLSVHVVYLPGFRNRLLVLLSWLQTYLLGDRPARQIIPTFTSDRLRKVQQAGLTGQMPQSPQNSNPQ